MQEVKIRLGHLIGSSLEEFAVGFLYLFETDFQIRCSLQVKESVSQHLTETVDSAQSALFAL